jgi:hypothetical protein
MGRPYVQGDSYRTQPNTSMKAQAFMLVREACRISWR